MTFQHRGNQTCEVHKALEELLPWERCVWVFFFQAEDGIRDLIVTGVQTCALPIFESRRPVVVSDARASDLIPPEWVETFALGSYLVVPLIRQDQVTGIMTLDYCERPTAFEPWQVDLAMTIAGQLALALANTRLYAEAQERLRETTTLMSVAQILSRPEPVAERMRQGAHEAGRAFGADMGGACLLDDRE